MSVTRLVLDTNVWLDWLLFNDPDIVPLKAAVADGRAVIFMDEAGAAELARVLAYPFQNRNLDAAAQAELVMQCARIARKAGAGRRAEAALLPKCSDPDDQKFLELASACGAAFLVTRDGALLELNRHKLRPLPYQIVTPAQLIAILKRGDVDGL